MLIWRGGAIEDAIMERLEIGARPEDGNAGMLRAMASLCGRLEAATLAAAASGWHLMVIMRQADAGRTAIASLLAKKFAIGEPQRTLAGSGNQDRMTDTSWLEGGNNGYLDDGTALVVLPSCAPSAHKIKGMICGDVGLQADRMRRLALGMPENAKENEPPSFTALR